MRGGGLFPVHRVYCVGRNYAAHTIEMGGDPDREEPFFFQKNPDNLVVTPTGDLLLCEDADPPIIHVAHGST